MRCRCICVDRHIAKCNRCMERLHHHAVHVLCTKFLVRSKSMLAETKVLLCAEVSIAYFPAAARRFMYSSKDSDLGMCVCLDFGSFGSRVVGFGSRVCGFVSARSYHNHEKMILFYTRKKFLLDQLQQCECISPVPHPESIWPPSCFTSQGL